MTEETEGQLRKRVHAILSFHPRPVNPRKQLDLVFFSPSCACVCARLYSPMARVLVGQVCSFVRSFYIVVLKIT